MWWIVRFTAYCPEVGEYWDKRFFDDYADALSFCRARDGVLSQSHGL
jgi:hypothetical protein